MTTSKASLPSQGVCSVCDRRNLRLKKDGTIWVHGDKRRKYGYGRAPECKGSSQLPKDVCALSGETLREEVTEALENVLPPGVNVAVVANAVLGRIRARVQHAEVQNSMLADLVVAADAYLDLGPEDARKPEWTYFTEALHSTAEELRVQYPRLRG